MTASGVSELLSEAAGDVPAAWAKLVHATVSPDGRFAAALIIYNGLCPATTSSATSAFRS